jgi:hypothetical protein
MEAEAAAVPCAPSAAVLGSAVSILEGIEALDEDSIGKVCFGVHGCVLVEARRICWASAAGMQQRLTERLRKQRNPPLTRAQIERVVVTCRHEGTPVGQALVASGLVSEAGLRVALHCHATEAIAELARVRAVQTAFVAHASVPYDDRFAFSTSEILAGLGAQRDYLDAATARTRLARAELAARDAFAFVRDGEGSRPIVIAVRNCRTRGVRELIDAASTACGLFDVADALGHGTLHAVGEHLDGAELVAWRDDTASYVAFCDHPPEAAS